MLVADRGGPTMFARIGMMKALNRHVERAVEANNIGGFVPGVHRVLQDQGQRPCFAGVASFDLNGEASTARTKQAARSSRQLRRIHQVINSEKVFGTHTLRKEIMKQNAHDKGHAEGTCNQAFPVPHHPAISCLLVRKS
jgi:hypothetical protein